jgi:mannose-1-phosphate guanylyltransferase
METASQAAMENNIVVFGVRPDAPKTGYGYIKCGAKLSGASAVFKVDVFKEKPDAAFAAAYIKDGSYLWNSGIYASRADFFLNELSVYAPQVYEAFSEVICDDAQLAKAYKNTPSISIDKAVSEKTRNAALVPASFEWDDAGTWDSLAKYKEPDTENGTEINCSGNFIYSDIPVEICGVDDIIVVVKNNKALIVKKGQSGNVIKITENSK